MVICHSRELAYQIKNEYDRFTKYMTGLKTAVVYGGMPYAENKKMFEEDCPHVVIGPPGACSSSARRP